MTFLVMDGVVYEKNLGPNTATEAAKLKIFNPTRPGRGFLIVLRWFC